MAFPYRIVVAWSEEDEAFVARVPALGVAVHGATEGEAALEARAAADLMLEAMHGEGRAVPAPDVSAHASGRVLLRMPKELHQELSDRAGEDGVSLNTYIVWALSERVGSAAALRRRAMVDAARRLGLAGKIGKAVALWDGTSRFKLERMPLVGASSDPRVAKEIANERTRTKPWSFELGSIGVLLDSDEGERLKQDLEAAAVMTWPGDDDT